MKQSIKETFKIQFGYVPTIQIHAPGRINLIGEHTDYNNGFVLPAAIDKGIQFALSLNPTGQLQVYSQNFEKMWSSKLDNIQKTEVAWANYLLGTILQFQKRNIDIIGIDCAFGGDIPIGSGMSSSAALVCGFAKALNEITNAGLNDWDIAKLGRQVENEFVGTACGIMDQFASVFGKENHAMLLDCRSLEFQYIPIKLKDHQLILLNSMVKHKNSDSGYNDRPADCQKAVKVLQKAYPNIQSFRDINADMLTAFKEESLKLKNRASFIIDENQRVQAACNALKENNLQTFGNLLFASHQGLDQEYEVSCPELNLLVQLAKQNGAIGARMMGGGFGGCTLNLFKSINAEATIQRIIQEYETKTNIKAEAYYISIKDGIKIINEDS